MSWTQSARRMGSKEASAKQIAAKRGMPAWREIMPAIIRAFERLRRTREWDQRAFVMAASENPQR